MQPPAVLSRPTHPYTLPKGGAKRSAFGDGDGQEGGGGQSQARLPAPIRIMANPIDAAAIAMATAMQANRTPHPRNSAPSRAAGTIGESR